MEEAADIRVAWQHAVSSGVERAKDKRNDQQALKRTRRKTKAASIAAPSSFVCRVGLYSHSETMLRIDIALHHRLPRRTAADDDDDSDSTGAVHVNIEFT